MSPRHVGIVNGNALKLGVFGANCSSGRTYAALPESWNASWDNNVKLASLADSYLPELLYFAQEILIPCSLSSLWRVPAPNFLSVGF